MMPTKRLDDIEAEIKKLTLLLEELNVKYDVLQAGPIFRKLSAFQSRLRRIKFRGNPGFNPEIRTHQRITEIRQQINSLRAPAKAKPVENNTPLVLKEPVSAPCETTKRPLIQKTMMGAAWQINLRRSSLTEKKGTINPTSLPPLPSEPKVSVIMTTYNASATVMKAVKSILDQTYRNLELIIVDDQSMDDTLHALNSIQESDHRVQVIPLDKNRGTYWAKNVGLEFATGDVITFMDSDDVSDPERIAKQIVPLQEAGIVATYCNCIRMDQNGDIVLNRGLRERLAPISLMIKRSALREIGWFDTVRTSADVEFLNRLKVTFGYKAIHLVAEPLYVALHWAGSLTLAQDNAVNLSGSDHTSLAPARKHYQDSFLHWHGVLATDGKRPYVPFPLTNRPFSVFRRLRLDGDRFLSTPIIACMATFPARSESLEHSVNSLLNQVDHLYIYLNGYNEVPSYLNNPKITAYAGGDDLRDAGKLFYLQDIDNAYCLLVDDDILYPIDYSERLVRHIELRDRKAIVGVHGVIFANPLDRYFSKNRTVHSFKHALSSPQQVNALGTGTIAFHTSTISLPTNIEDAQGMVDIWMALAAKERDIPMYAIPRDAGWMKAIAQENNTNLYDEFVEDDSRQTDMLRTVVDWTIS